VPLGRFSAATDFELGPISPLLASIDFSAGFSEKSARVFSQLLCSCFADKKNLQTFSRRADSPIQFYLQQPHVYIL
jgi:retron-type reverse transcriptase